MVSPLLSRSAPMDAEAMPFPSDDTTPPVTKMNFVLICFLGSAIMLKTEFRIQKKTCFYSDSRLLTSDSFLLSFLLSPNPPACQPQRNYILSAQPLSYNRSPIPLTAQVFPHLPMVSVSSLQTSAENLFYTHKARYACSVRLKAEG